MYQDSNFSFPFTHITHRQSFRWWLREVPEVSVVLMLGIREPIRSAKSYGCAQPREHDLISRSKSRNQTEREFNMSKEGISEIRQGRQVIKQICGIRGRAENKGSKKLD